MDNHATISTFDPKPDVVIDVTEMLIDRHFEMAVLAINTALKCHCTGVSMCDNAFADSYQSKHHLWIPMGQFPLSAELKKRILHKYHVKNGTIQFLHWEAMEQRYPDISQHFRLLHSKTPICVGFPLPEESDEL